MAYTASSKRFTQAQMEAGTDVDTWLATLTITTFKGMSTCEFGSGYVLITVLYE